MTPDIDSTDIKLNTITQMLRKWDLIKLTNVNIDIMQEIERRHLSMAFQGGQSNALTFDEWYDKTFSKEDK